ncbi:hypothetical protein TYRP_016940 [Tyrophagus putrescentiae]|nr:hypothetical protein TYRP_016940 [Tyrophagus putrescentiae]
MSTPEQEHLELFFDLRTVPVTLQRELVRQAKAACRALVRLVIAYGHLVDAGQVSRLGELLNGLRRHMTEQVVLFMRYRLQGVMPTWHSGGHPPAEPLLSPEPRDGLPEHRRHSHSGAFRRAAPPPQSAELNCEFGSLKEVFKNCKTDTLNKERFNDFTFLKVKASCCSIAQYRICSIVNTEKTIWDSIKLYEKKHCGLQGAQTFDCVYNNETLKTTLLVIAILGFSWLTFCFWACIIFCTKPLWVNWLLAMLSGTTLGTDNIEMTTPEQEHL